MTHTIAIALMLFAPLLTVAALRTGVEPQRVKPECLK